MDTFLGYHSEWNLGSPGGWDYQRITQLIGKAVWAKLDRVRPRGVELDFDHPCLCPVTGFAEMLIEAHRARSGSNGGTIAVVAEEETLEDVTENINLARRLDDVDGISSALMAPHELELVNGTVCWRGNQVSVIFADFNTDVLMDLHRKQDLAALVQAVGEGRVVNPRGTEPINVKSMFEVLGGPHAGRFHEETVRRTPWTRRFFPRRTTGPRGEAISDLVDWTREHWEDLVLKPERGYSGKGVRVGGVHGPADDAVAAALSAGDYIVQEKIPLELWAEDNPALDRGSGRVEMRRYQTDFRCLMGPKGVFGFLVRFGGVPTNVGSGGGVQPLAVLRSDMSVRDAVERINDAMLQADPAEIAEAIDLQERLAREYRFTYLLGTIPITLRPRLVTPGQLVSLSAYCGAMWSDCLVLEQMWLAGELDEYVAIDEDELAVCRSQPWQGSAAIFASDGLFSFGAHPQCPDR